MKKVNKKLLAIVERATRTEVARNANNTFPFCVGFFHQPMRPETSSKKK